MNTQPALDEVNRIIHEAAQRATKISIITFNHDLVIENEIFKRARLRKRWCLDEGYGSFGTSMTATAPRSRGVAKFPVHDAGCDHTRPITVYKLHGSLNWYVKMRGKTPTRSLLTGGSGPKKIAVTRQRTLAAQVTVSNQRSKPGRGGRAR